MNRQVPGLAETARDSRPEIPDGIFLVRVDAAQFGSLVRVGVEKAKAALSRRSPAGLAAFGMRLTTPINH